MKSGQEESVLVPMSFPNIRLFLYFSCFTVWWLLCFVFIFSMFEKDRTHTLTHLNFGWQFPFSARFSFLTYYYYHITLIIIRQKGLELDGDKFVFCFIMSYVCVFYYGWRKERGFLRLGGLVGWLVTGRGFWIGFPFLIPCTFFFFFFPFFLLLSLLPLDTSMDFSQTPQHAVAAWTRVKRTCFSVISPPPLSFTFILYGGWLVNGACLLLFIFFFLAWRKGISIG